MSPAKSIHQLDPSGAARYVKALGGNPPRRISQRWVSRVAALEELESELCTFGR